MRRVLIDMLDLRGVDVSPLRRELIEACEDLDQLERWYDRVRSAPVEELVSLFERQSPTP